MVEGLCGLACFLPDISENWIPVVAVISGTLMVVIIVALSLMNKQHQQELEHTLQIRRMEHERRMKELDLELARLHAAGQVRQ